MWKSAYVGVYQLLNWKMHGETLKFTVTKDPKQMYEQNNELTYESLQIL